MHEQLNKTESCYKTSPGILRYLSEYQHRGMVFFFFFCMCVCVCFLIFSIQNSRITSDFDLQLMLVSTRERSAPNV